MNAQGGAPGDEDFDEDIMGSADSREPWWRHYERRQACLSWELLQTLRSTSSQGLRGPQNEKCQELRILMGNCTVCFLGFCIALSLQEWRAPLTSGWLKCAYKDPKCACMREFHFSKCFDVCSSFARGGGSSCLMSNMFGVRGPSTPDHIV